MTLSDTKRGIGAQFIALLVALSLLRLFFAFHLGLSPDEAYYWTWSKNIQMTYGDHPPLVAWLIWMGTKVLGATPLGVRAPFILLGFGGIYVVFLIGCVAGLSRKQAQLAGILSSLLPVCSAGALLATPDTPLGFFWVVGIWALIRLSVKPRPFLWYILGGAVALGFWAKFSALLLFAVIIVALFAARDLRKELKTPHPWLSIAGVFVLISIYVWLDLHSGHSAIFLQFEHLKGNMPTEPNAPGPLTILVRVFELVLGQAGLLTPVVGACLVLGIVLLKRDKTVGPILVSGMAVPLLAAFCTVFFTHPEQNWAALGHPLAAVVAVMGARASRSKHQWFLGMGGSVVLVAVVIHIHALRPFLPLPPSRDPVSRLHGFEDLESIRDLVVTRDAVLCDNYGLAAELAWQFRDAPRAPVVWSTDRPSTVSILGGTWLLLDEEGDWGGYGLPDCCAKKREAGFLVLRRADGVAVRKIAVFEGENCEL